MKLRIKRFDPSLPLPRYQTQGAACVDLCARIDTTIEPKSFGYIPLNVAIEIPEGYWGMLAARGSTHKAGLIPANGLGIVDWDFRGDNNEYIFPVYNLTEEAVHIEKGRRICQLMIMKYERVDFEEVDQLEHPNRGAFGSTGEA